MTKGKWEGKIIFSNSFSNCPLLVCAFSLTSLGWSKVKAPTDKAPLRLPLIHTCGVPSIVDHLVNQYYSFIGEQGCSQHPETCCRCIRSPYFLLLAELCDGRRANSHLRPQIIACLLYVIIRLLLKQNKTNCYKFGLLLNSLNRYDWHGASSHHILGVRSGITLFEDLVD